MAHTGEDNLDAGNYGRVPCEGAILNDNHSIGTVPSSVLGRENTHWKWRLAITLNSPRHFQGEGLTANAANQSIGSCLSIRFYIVAGLLSSAVQNLMWPTESCARNFAVNPVCNFRVAHVLLAQGLYQSAGTS